MIDINDQLVAKILEFKGHGIQNIDFLKNILSITFKTKYRLLCLDIDNTIINEEGIIPQNIINSIVKHIENKTKICFITGRGEKKARAALIQLLDKIVISNKNLILDFMRNCYCVINNGIFLLSTDGYKYENFLMKSELLIDNNVSNIFQNNKEVIRDKIIQLLSLKYGIDAKKLIKESIENSKDLLLRIIAMNDKNIDDICVCNYISEIIKSYNFEDIMFLNKSCYLNKLIFEIGVTTKGYAINNISNILNIHKDAILRIGDQGSYYGNDFDMLNCPQGFSVMEISNKIDGCYPVIGNDNELLIGCDATAYLLDAIL